MMAGLPLYVYCQETFQAFTRNSCCFMCQEVYTETPYSWTVILALGLQSVQEASKQLNVCLHERMMVKTHAEVWEQKSEDQGGR